MHRESFALLRPASLRGRRDALVPPPRSRGTVPPRAFGVARVDAWLGGGLKGDGLHEFHAAGSADLASTLGLALLIGLGTGEGRRLLWLRRTMDGSAPYGPGLADLGLDPAAITLLALRDERALLRATLDGVRAGAASMVLLELAGRQPRLDLTATRRLLLAAGETGTLVVLVRSGADLAPSAATSRWRAGSALSRPLAADAPGRPAFVLDLLRLRGGREGLRIFLEWNRDTASFSEQPAPTPAILPAIAPGADAAPLSGSTFALAAGGERADPRDRAA